MGLRFGDSDYEYIWDKDSDVMLYCCSDMLWIPVLLYERCNLCVTSVQRQRQEYARCS